VQDANEGLRDRFIDSSNFEQSVEVAVREAGRQPRLATLGGWESEVFAGSQEPGCGDCFAK
jgi:hypothetical protein